MKLTIEQAASRLGKSVRQVRYMIQTGRLPAEKSGKQWLIDSDDLSLSEGQQKAAARKERQLRAAVEQGLGLPEESEREPRYSVGKIKAFQLALPIRRQAVERFGKDHPAAVNLRHALEYLALGCHRFEYRSKIEAYNQARDAASLAVCELMLCENEEANELVIQIEQELMAAFAGLIRLIERKRQQ